MPPAARMGDQTLHDAPHCHAPIHPPAPVPTPVPHPPIPFPIMVNCVPTVLIANLPAAVVGSMTQPCLVPPCVPGGPGTIAMAFTSCVAPIPSPTGKILPPGAPTVIIGG